MQTVNSFGCVISGKDGIEEGASPGCCVGQKYFV